jgi:hypothetical protein
MRAHGPWLLSAFVLALPLLARAEITLRVEADEGTQAACPTEDSLRERLAKAGAELRGSYTVRFTRSGRGYQVHIAGDGEKTLRDPSCAALGDAVVATLLVLAEGDATDADAGAVASPMAGDADGARDGSPAEASTAAAVATDAAEGAPTPDASTLPFEVSGGALVGLAYGVGSDVAPVLALFARVAPFSRLRLGVGGRYAFAADRVVGTGTVGRTVLGGWVDACYPIYGATVRLGACAFFAFHAVTATASGFLSNGSATQARLSLGPALEFDDASLRPLSWFVRAELDIPILREAFTISGAGPDYEAPALGGSVFVGGKLHFP